MRRRWINDDRLDELIGGMWVGAAIAGGVAGLLSLLVGIAVLLTKIGEALT